MSTTTIKPISELEHPAPSLPLEFIGELGEIYVMYYRNNMDPNCSKGFRHKGDLRSAVRRSQEHCRIMGYKWTFVRPLVVNIDEEETKKLNFEN